MSLTDSVIYIQRAYRAFKAQKSGQVDKVTTTTPAVPVDNLADSPQASGTVPAKDENQHQFNASDRQVEIVEEIKEEK